LKEITRGFFLSPWERIEVRAFFLRGDLKEITRGFFLSPWERIEVRAFCYLYKDK